MNLVRETLNRPLGPVIALVILGLLIIAPKYAERYTIISLITILMYVILTLSWTIFSGPTHYISLATAAFFGVGVYVSAVLNRQLPLPAIAVISGGISFFLALLIGLLTLRLKGTYFILFTFGVSALIRHSLTWWETHITSTVGRFVRGPGNEAIFYYMVSIAALTLLTAYMIKHTQLGLALKSIGEDEEAATHIGIDITMVKVLTFAISAVFMGATGTVMANRWTYIDPTIAFNPLISFLPVLMAIFGGTSRLYGPIIGATAFTLLQEFLITEYPYLYMLLMGIVLILVILYLPNGLLGLIDKGIQRLNQIEPIRKVIAKLQEVA